MKRREFTTLFGSGDGPFRCFGRSQRMFSSRRGAKSVHSS